ncbi:hypothetical protein O988_06358, partial [Pseudogymnoascus sp. VKM F-3808]
RYWKFAGKFKDNQVHHEEP